VVTYTLADDGQATPADQDIHSKDYELFCTPCRKVLDKVFEFDSDDLVVRVR
jgi:hypothetical protein